MGDLYSSLIKTFSLEPLDPPMILLMAVLFFAFWKLLMERGVFRPQLEIFEDRTTATEGLRAKAAVTMREATALIEKYDTRLNEVRAEAFGFKSGELAVAHGEASEMVRKAEAEAETILEEARRKNESFVDQARADARGQADVLAQSMASTVTNSLRMN